MGWWFGRGEMWIEICGCVRVKLWRRGEVRNVLLRGVNRVCGEGVGGGRGR